MTVVPAAPNGAPIDVAIIGAGPYGLSIAAHLTARGVPFRIFGTPMQAWRQHMPRGMCLKSDGFASDLYDPASTLTLGRYCGEQGLEYADVGHPVPLQTFIDYGREFQRRFVPQLEDVQITRLAAAPDGFSLTTSTGETLGARRVVVAVGISRFGHLPPVLSGLPAERLSHSSAHGDLGGFRGRRVLVIGGGSSAADIAALLHEAGAEVQWAARRGRIAFHDKAEEPRPLLERLRRPRSGLGIGWKSQLCTSAPWLFHAMPADFRVRVVKNHLGPAPGWFIKDKLVGKVPMHLGATPRQAEVRQDRLHVTFERQGGGTLQLDAEHVIAATGYRVALERLDFLDPALRGRIGTLDGAPVLRRNFESSVPGLFMVGVASANSFGPLCRFACGAQFTARRITPALAALP